MKFQTEHHIERNIGRAANIANSLMKKCKWIIYRHDGVILEGIIFKL
jgi:hypothetical protein